MDNDISGKSLQECRKRILEAEFVDKCLCSDSDEADGEEEEENALFRRKKIKKSNLKIQLEKRWKLNKKIQTILKVNSKQETNIIRKKMFLKDWVFKRKEEYGKAVQFNEKHFQLDFEDFQESSDDAQDSPDNMKDCSDGSTTNEMDIQSDAEIRNDKDNKLAEAKSVKEMKVLNVLKLHHFLKLCKLLHTLIVISGPRTKSTFDLHLFLCEILSIKFDIKNLENDLTNLTKQMYNVLDQFRKFDH